MSKRKTMSKRRAKRLLQDGWYIADRVVAEHRLMEWMAERGYTIQHDPVSMSRGIRRVMYIKGWAVNEDWSRRLVTEEVPIPPRHKRGKEMSFRSIRRIIMRRA